MEYNVEKLEKSKVDITVTLQPDEWQVHEEKAIGEMGKDLKVEGFRQGKAPDEMVKQQYGDQAIMAETARYAVEHAYKEIAQKEGLDVIGEPEVNVTKLAPDNPFEFKITVSTVPELELPDYKKIASGVSKQEVAVEDTEVDSALEWIKNSRKQEGEDAPELNDEFAKTLGNFEGMDEVKASIKEGLQEEKKQKEVQRMRQEILDKIAEQTKGDVPEVLVERERQGMMENVKKGVKEQLGMEFPEYLEKVNKTEEQLQEEFADQAEKRVKASLVLREIAKKEEVQVTDEELQQGMQQILSQYPDAEKAKESIDEAQLRSYAQGVLENEKTLQVLESQSQENGSEK